VSRTRRQSAVKAPSGLSAVKAERRARHLPQQDPERTGVDQQVGARQAGEQPYAADQEAPYLVT